ncbi:TetR/AcrR family transcriptional regulator [Kineococcus sp. DHX-1]|uniref:TetR/AcrR family transcriptional regulator n=1 Tax=Kineococcus sp. DHX-1 TaxID=3349638 RepID=UPI0036D2EA43
MRYDDLAVAALDLAAEGGLEAVSVRTVAARAGVSPGLVQHRYGTKQQLLLAAMELVVQRVQARLEAADAAADASANSRLRYRAEQLLPLDAQRRTEARVWLTFVARAAVDEQVAALHSQFWQAMQDSFAELLAARRGQMSGDRLEDAESPVHEAVSDRDADDAACLLAALDGMAIANIAESGRMNTRRLNTLLDQLLD